MGDKFTVEPDSQKARYLKVNVYGTSSIETVNIVKNSRTLESIPGHEQLDIEISYSDSVTEKETDYYYVHVIQVDDE